MKLFVLFRGDTKRERATTLYLKDCDDDHTKVHMMAVTQNNNDTVR